MFIQYFLCCLAMLSNIYLSSMENNSQPLRSDKLQESGIWTKIHNDSKEDKDETREMRVRKIDIFNPSNQKHNDKEVFVVTHQS